MIDPTSRVVQRCVAGMQAEAAGDAAAAREHFARAWDARRDDAEACIAAHYLARHQDRDEDTLRWNLTALRHADAAGDERVGDFYPSLYLNLGHSLETAGDAREARRYYDLAAARVDRLPDGPYRELVRRGIAAGHARTRAGQTCEQRET